MKRIQITPAWYFSDESGNQIDPTLFALLEAIHRHGKLTQAAEDAGVSYRHAWNLLKKWEQFFGTPLVELTRGRGAQLSPLGKKLLWAEQRVIARLGPQLESLGSELNLAIQQQLEGVQPVLRLHASHGFAVELLPKYLQELSLDLQYCSPREALATLNRGACDLAGFHLPQGPVGQQVIRDYQGLLKPRSHRVIGFISRNQGLMVAPGNPLGVDGLPALAGRKVRFINRQATSGTRALLDGLLNEAGIRPSAIPGYEVEEYTHSAVAAYVAAGMADAGFGVEAAAQRFGLDFVPLAQENYLLVCQQRSLQDSRFMRLLEILRSEDFQKAVSTLPGYAPHRCGQVIETTELLLSPRS
ncbi:substrate-binding domain-containing protein [Halomonas binhaiensis]|uniref:Helix-turn-helix transcriptional regulator n=1 Tax=Halomonas binhaiensis TaxID=2562282 RepID=A0A5C1NJL9_9GAMM|nr:substrate-binding domain-containing protein [Halomonas binhaiensis]QEM82315.1 helix-turn-helix transcriptional regulator [Halomonas binhaiensis]